MADETKKVIKKKIKLKVSPHAEKTRAKETDEKIVVKKKTVTHAPAHTPSVQTPAPATPAVDKNKPEKERHEAARDHLKKMNEKFGGPVTTFAPSDRPRPFGDRPRPMGPGRTGPGAAGGPGRRFIAKDKSFGPRPGGPGSAPAGKDSARNKHKAPSKSRMEAVMKEKNKSKEEELLLSKWEDSILKRKKGEAVIPEEIEIAEVIKVSDLAKKMNLKASEIIQKLMDLGVQATINDSIDADTATLAAGEFNCKVTVRSIKEEVVIKETEDTPEDLKPRSPVVTIMGHVDHGKTSLLDAIRDSSVAAHETGGITQHIGAYRVQTPKGMITFVDTPGHEAFTAMRARGANVTDLVILVVSAVEGVMPQTVEALNHAKAAKVPIIVAMNKMDLPGTNPERLKQQLAEHSILSEEWGGDSIFVPVSAVKKTGIQELLDSVLLQAEVMELKANPDKRGVGFVVESKMDIGRGAVATVIVKNGRIKVGDYFVVGTSMGKVRGMFDESGAKMTSALPSDPVEIMGFNEVPNAGDKFYVVEDENTAKDIAAKRLNLKRIEDGQTIKKVQMQNAMEMLSSADLRELKIIVKADVQGSVEAIRTSLEKLSTPDVKVSVIHGGVGSVLESDVLLATSTAGTAETGVMILAFRVRVDAIAKDKAESDGITVKRFAIIYEIIDFVDGIVKGMRKTEVRETVIGSAEVKEVFKIKDVGKIAGCQVTQGFIRKSESVRLFRDGAQVWSGKIKDLKRFKEDASEVQEGFECGISLVNYENIKKGDQIECYSVEEIKPA